MVGDGITDLEAVQEGGGADLFIGFGGGQRLGVGWLRLAAWRAPPVSPLCRRLRNAHTTQQRPGSPCPLQALSGEGWWRRLPTGLSTASRCCRRRCPAIVWP